MRKVTEPAIELKRESGVPAFRQIIDQIAFLIASGRLAPGEPLPATRGLAAALGINPMTVSKAYGYLEQEGVVRRRPGKAVVVADTARAVDAAGPVEQMRRHLAPCVVVAEQLGLERSEVLALFSEMLAGAPQKQPTQVSRPRRRTRDGWQNW